MRGKSGLPTLGGLAQFLHRKCPRIKTILKNEKQNNFIKCLSLQIHLIIVLPLLLQEVMVASRLEEILSPGCGQFCHNELGVYMTIFKWQKHLQEQSFPSRAGHSGPIKPRQSLETVDSCVSCDSCQLSLY